MTGRLGIWLAIMMLSAPYLSCSCGSSFAALLSALAILFLDSHSEVKDVNPLEVYALLVPLDLAEDGEFELDQPQAVVPGLREDGDLELLLLPVEGEEPHRAAEVGALLLDGGPADLLDLAADQELAVLGLFLDLAGGRDPLALQGVPDLVDPFGHRVHGHVGADQPAFEEIDLPGRVLGPGDLVLGFEPNDLLLPDLVLLRGGQPTEFVDGDVRQNPMAFQPGDAVLAVPERFESTQAD